MCAQRGQMVPRMIIGWLTVRIGGAKQMFGTWCVAWPAMSQRRFRCELGCQRAEAAREGVKGTTAPRSCESSPEPVGGEGGVSPVRTAELLHNMPVQIIEEPVNKPVKAKRVGEANSAAVVADAHCGAASVALPLLTLQPSCHCYGNCRVQLMKW
jgi:hypothetical protein